MTNFTIHILNRTYNSWKIIPENKNIDILPYEQKLFHNDVFTIDKHNHISVVSSPLKSVKIAGILVLSGNKTYGRNAKGKTMYKFVPDDYRLPHFLVPYIIKELGFSKVMHNLYAVIVFEEWQTKHPIGKLDQVIGTVTSLDSFYEYQLCCKYLNIPIEKFKKKTMSLLTSSDNTDLIDKIALFNPYIKNRTDGYHIITIDPENSKDFDDGVSICNLPNNITQLSVYISNVPILIYSLNLFEHMSERISTIYLPNRTSTMLPELLCNHLCSLKENVSRIAFVMDIFIKDNCIIDIKFENALIKVHKNYCYEEYALKNDRHYQQLFTLITNLNKQNYYTEISDSHDVVSYLMILMNYHCANKLLQHKTGIFRSTILKDNPEHDLPGNLPSDIYKFMKTYGSMSGQYIDCAKSVMLRHDALQLDAYIHITSPIRRLVDLLNMIKFQEVFHMINTTTFTRDAGAFYDKWINRIDYINTTMRSIKKVQTDCNLLFQFHNNPNMLNKIYTGYLFDKIYIDEFLIQYNVYLPDLKLTKKIVIRENFDNYSCKTFQLYLFNDEENLKKKIRIQLII